MTIPATDAEIRQKCEEIWKVKNTWGLTFDDLVRCSYSHGQDGKGPINGFEDEPGDTVYVHPNGSEMTRYMCSNWITDWYAFSHGFKTAWRLMEEKQNEH